MYRLFNYLNLTKLRVGFNQLKIINIKKIKNKSYIISLYRLLSTKKHNNLAYALDMLTINKQISLKKNIVTNNKIESNKNEKIKATNSIKNIK
jgi:hypothetical protein